MIENVTLRSQSMMVLPSQTRYEFCRLYAIVNLTIRECPHISNSRFGFVLAPTESYLPERGADSG